MAAVRSGASLREAARRSGVCLRTVQRWVGRARGKALPRADFRAMPRGGFRRRTAPEAEDLVLEVRRFLQEESSLGHFGAAAIRDELAARGCPDPPSVRTIGRILVRRGAAGKRPRVRRAPPPPGWHLPDAAGRAVELDSFDFVSGLRIKGGPSVEVLNAVSLHGGLTGSQPKAQAFHARDVTAALEHRWRLHGLPAYAQFDNDTVFQGPRHHAGLVLGEVARFCLALGVAVVFAPPREHGLQNLVEGFNGHWQSKVWHRFEHKTLAALCERSDAYNAELARRRAARIGDAPARKPFPRSFAFDPAAEPARGEIVWIRRTDAGGFVDLFAARLLASERWPNKLVRVTADIAAGTLEIHALSRSNHAHQPLLAEHPLPQTAAQRRASREQSKKQPRKPAKQPGTRRRKG